MSSNSEKGLTEGHRGRLLKEIDEVKDLFYQDAVNRETRLQFATLLYQAGSFSQSRECLLPLLNSPHPPVEALQLAAELEYLVGNYTRAEDLFKSVIDSTPNEQVQRVTQIKLGFVYYQTNQYAKSRNLGKGIEHPLLDLIKSFQQESPNQIEWDGNTETIVPFLMTDPLPLIPVRIQGQPIYACIDTGGDSFVLDNKIAGSLGIEPISSMTGSFGGGKQAEVGFSRAEHLQIGGVTIKSVPLALLPTQRFSGLTGGQYTIGGILGTRVLQQFLSTIDYVNGKLILRKKSASKLELEGKTVAEVPFFLAATHFMMAKGKLNDRDDLTFFIDSGLASEAAFAAPIQTLKFVGIPAPKREIPEDTVGGGGGKWASGLFSIETLGLGTLIQHHLKGEYGSLPPESYWRHGFVQDGILSHRFLCQYVWTIDFSAMKMIFVQ